VSVKIPARGGVHIHSAPLYPHTPHFSARSCEHGFTCPCLV
jgi:hypothetical protein